MASRRLKQIMVLIEALTENERAEFLQQSSDLLSKLQYDGLKSKPTTLKTTQCPDCQSEKLKKYGYAKGRRRYKCASCGRIFNQLSNSAISGTHFPEKWPKFVGCMVEGISVAKTAKKIGVSVPTAFAWRHKLLRKFEKDAETKLQGIVEADETFFLFSQKGSRGIKGTRKPRKRGGKAKTAGISDDQVPVIAGCDRHGNVILGVAGRGRISMADIETVMNEHINDDITLCTDGHSSFKAYAKTYQFSYVGLNISQGKRIMKKKYHIQNVNNFHSRLKQWMHRFNGVSTKYLQNYMNWFALLEETKNNAADQARRFMERTVELS